MRVFTSMSSMGIADGEEVWRVIDGFPAYQVSNMGRVKRNHDGGVLSQFQDRGTPFVKLRTGLPRAEGVRREDAQPRKEIKCAVYLLVAAAFLDKPTDAILPVHRDGDRTNTKASNLYYLSSATKHRMRLDRSNHRRREKNRIRLEEARKAKELARTLAEEEKEWRETAIKLGFAITNKRQALERMRAILREK